MHFFLGALRVKIGFTVKGSAVVKCSGSEQAYLMYQIHVLTAREWPF